MSTDVVDARLVGAVHVARHRRRDVDEDAGGAAAHELWQVSTVQALLDGAYDGDLTIGELLAHGDLGLGTVQHLDGELVVLDGEAHAVRSDGRVERVGEDVRTPFAVVCRFEPQATGRVAGLVLDDLLGAIDGLAPVGAPVVAVRVTGTFVDVHLRSVPAQSPPYPPLTEVVEHQTTWSVPEVVGTLVGFRFPSELGGVEVPGYHLHLLSDDRRVGGHVTGLAVVEGVAAVDGGSDLHVEVPVGQALDAVVAGAGGDTAAAIRRVEGGGGRAVTT